MLLKKIVWIYSKVSNDYSNISPFWVLRIGLFIVNIIHNKASIEDLTNTIAAVRTIRVGNEARYPMITIYTTMERVKSELIEEICKSDTSTPRIRLIILVNKTDYNQEKLDAIISLSKAHYLDTKILFILNEKLLNPSEIIINKRNTVNILYEWFPALGKHDDNTKYNEVIRWLDGIEYDYSRHPLYLCGAISLISREMLISQHELKCKKYDSNPKINHSELLKYLDIFSHTNPNCLLGVVAELFNDIAYTKTHICSCKANLELPLDIEKIVTIESTCGQKDLRLFEDWQYIYDGFEYV